MVKIGIAGMSDDLTRDKVVSSSEIKIGYVKPIASLNRFNTESAMAALLIIKADRIPSQI